MDGWQSQDYIFNLRFERRIFQTKSYGGLGNLLLTNLLPMNLLLISAISYNLFSILTIVKYSSNLKSCFRFEHTCVAYDKALAKYVVNTANLNATVADNTPRLTFSFYRDHFLSPMKQYIYFWKLGFGLCKK